MAGLWPRNIVPIGDDIVKLLGSDRALALYLAALDAPVPLEDLVRVTGRPREDAERMAGDLVAHGLLRIDNGRYAAGHAHLREEDLEAPDRGAFHLAVLNAAQGALDETRHGVRTRRERVKVGVGMVTLPDEPETLARAGAILAEAEDQLRVLQNERPPSDASHRVRIILFVGSTSDVTT